MDPNNQTCTSVLDDLLVRMRSSDALEVLDALDALNRCGAFDIGMLDRLAELLSHTNPFVRRAAIGSLSRLESRYAAAFASRVVSLLNDADSPVAKAAVQFVGVRGTRDPDIIETLKTNALSENDEVSEASVVALANLGRLGREALLDCLESDKYSDPLNFAGKAGHLPVQILLACGDETEQQVIARLHHLLVSKCTPLLISMVSTLDIHSEDIRRFLNDKDERTLRAALKYVERRSGAKEYVAEIASAMERFGCARSGRYDHSGITELCAQLLIAIGRHAAPAAQAAARCAGYGQCHGGWLQYAKLLMAIGAEVSVPALRSALREVDARKNEVLTAHSILLEILASFGSDAALAKPEVLIDLESEYPETRAAATKLIRALKT